MSFWQAVKWRFTLLSQWIKASKDIAWGLDYADIIFISADANKTVLGDGPYQDRILDPLRAHFEKAGFLCVSVGRVGSQITGQLRSNYVFSLNKRAFAIQFLSSLWMPLVKLGIKDIQSADPEGSKVYESLIRTLKPQAILALGPTPGLCQAGYRTRTPVLEVLHARGYSIPYSSTWANQPDENLPRGVLAYDDASALAFSSRLPTLRIPNYRLAAELTLANQFSFEHAVTGSPVPVEASRRILLTASYDPARPTWPAGPPVELLNLIEQNQDLFLMVRVHPVMRTDAQFETALRKLTEQVEALPNADIHWATTAPIYAVLETTDIHFTLNSLSAYEAADLGIQTFVFEFGHSQLAEAMLDLQQEGYVMAIRSRYTDIEKAIRNATKLRPWTGEDEAINVHEILEFSSKVLELPRQSLN